MKFILVALAVLACSAVNASAQEQRTINPATDEAVYMAPVSIDSVTQEPNSVNLEVSLNSCASRLVTFAANADTALDRNGKLNIYVAALATEPKAKLACRSWQVPKRVFLGSNLSVSKEDIQLHVLGVWEDKENSAPVEDRDYTAVFRSGTNQGVEVQPCASHPGAACDPYSMLKIGFGVRNCSARMGQVSYNVSFADDGKIDVYVAAVEISKDPTMITCQSARIETVKIPLGMGFFSAENIRLHFLGRPMIRFLGPPVKARGQQ